MYQRLSFTQILTFGRNNFSYLYNSVAILVASDIFLQSINQNLADTVVVNETQSLTNVRGVEPVTSSHCALVVPPVFFYKK
jgi:hypothetical protein